MGLSGLSGVVLGVRHLGRSTDFASGKGECLEVVEIDTEFGEGGAFEEFSVDFIVEGDIAFESQGGILFVDLVGDVSGGDAGEFVDFAFGAESDEGFVVLVIRETSGFVIVFGERHRAAEAEPFDENFIGGSTIGDGFFFGGFFEGGEDFLLGGFFLFVLFEEGWGGAGFALSGEEVADGFADFAIEVITAEAVNFFEFGLEEFSAFAVERIEEFVFGGFLEEVHRLHAGGARDMDGSVEATESTFAAGSGGDIEGFAAVDESAARGIDRLFGDSPFDIEGMVFDGELGLFSAKEFGSEGGFDTFGSAVESDGESEGALFDGGGVGEREMGGDAVHF